MFTISYIVGFIVAGHRE